jgi:hypothetical protein
MLANSWVALRLAASQKGLSYMELVINCEEVGDISPIMKEAEV